MVAPAPPRRAGAKAWLKRLHLWLGLSVGVVFALIALSGSVLALQQPLLRISQPQLALHPLPTAAQRAQVMARVSREWAPQGLRGADLPDAALPVWQLYFADGSRRYLHPASGELLLTRHAGADPLLILRNWHTHLLAGRTGENVLGVIGWVCLFLLGSGLVLWWPARGRLRAHLRPYAQPPIRRWLTWHRSLGAITLPLLLLLTLTGTLMAYHGATRRVLEATLGKDPSAAPPPTLASRDQPVDWATLLHNAQAAMPHATLSRISLGRRGDATVVVRARAPGEWNETGRSMIWLDPYTARVLAVRDAGAGDTAARVDGMIYPLHAGTVGGTGYRAAVVAGGLLPAFFAITGFLFWRARTRRRH
ncbi:PepSY-associated TM helix domain-containing protein [Dyella sp.]|jgi:uncharacterized iron-regulated membrane protein|uniref:PepSY-associated TM helix domain-containing protein n=1 Tax=Dyella sp. TaxID=1869338 RepID=UPI002D7A3E58|nr:PepSY-associated TM helix domain-containing protein [Dyella sp.]HET6433392.1 PepSY-associated TM helix domain-containing protein [Dyella sp.]